MSYRIFNFKNLKINIKYIAILSTLLNVVATFSQSNSFFHHNCSGELIIHKYHTIYYSEQHEQASVVSYMVCRDHLNKKLSRKNTFSEDPMVKTRTAHPSDYTNSHYDKGHLCPAADMTFNDTAMKESFYMSNISPQETKFNRGIWKQLEIQIRKWVKEKDTIYIVTGPILKDFIDTIGVKNKIPVPKYFYKIILKYNGTNSYAIAFIIPNASCNKPLSTYATTIDEVEKQTNIDFFPKLPDSVENLLENQIHLDNWIFTNLKNH